MNIYSILQSKPHNIHYLKRYYSFIEWCRLINTTSDEDFGYTENHHILPKALKLFPEYSSFVAYPDNRIRLTGRQHTVAHHLLARAYPGTGMVLAYLRLSKSGKPGQKISSRQTELAKIRNSKEQSTRILEWYENNEHPRGMLGKKHTKETKDYISLITTGVNNPMYSIKRPDLSISNNDPILKVRRGISSSKTKILKNCRLYGFESTDECFEYFSYTADMFKDCPVRQFTINITEKFLEDFPERIIPDYNIRYLLRYLNIEFPHPNKVGRRL